MKTAVTLPAAVAARAFAVAAIAVAAVLLVGVVLIAGACSPSDDRRVVLVMAAASLTDAFDAIEAAFEQQHTDLDVQLNLAGSAALREQVLQGAPADVFASANEATMQQVVDARAAAAPMAFATNAVTIAVPAGNPAAIGGIEDLARSELLVGLCAEGVPCGDAARAALDRAGVGAAVDTNEGDVRALLTKIEAGELDAGIVYRTDVASSTAVDEVALADGISPTVVYPIAVLTEAPNADGAERFVAFVLSPVGQTLLAERGFGAP